MNTKKDVQLYQSSGKYILKPPWESTTHTYTRMAKWKQLSIPNGSKVVEEQELLCIAGGSVNWYKKSEILCSTTQVKYGMYDLYIHYDQ